MTAKNTKAAWRDYQEDAAALFRKMGFEATVEKVIRGARGKHKVDVVAETQLGGLSVRWLIECKHWKSAVSKAHVLTLAQIVQDTGADRGVLLSEKGFQAGAIAVSRKSNVLLTSLEELASSAADSIAELSIKRTLQRVKDLEEQLRDDMDEFGLRTPIPPELDSIIDLLGVCLVVTLAIVATQTGRFPVALPSVLVCPPEYSDDVIIIAQRVEAVAEEIATKRSQLQVEISDLLKPYIDQSEKLIGRVRELMVEGTALLDASSEADEVKLQNVVASMKAVGACAANLQSPPSQILSKAVQAVMRELIDGVYLWFADPKRTPEDWDILTAKTESAVAGLAKTVAALRSETS